MNGEQTEIFPAYKKTGSGKILGSDGDFFLAEPSSYSLTYNKLFAKDDFFIKFVVWPESNKEWPELNENYNSLIRHFLSPHQL